jgi:N-acyl amino acid synthase of PEP-CTERM/exosortase system
MQNPKISEQFCEQFQLQIANTLDLKKEVYRIRYEVYSQELNYEPPEKFPDGLEMDRYDERSIHCLLQHRASGIYAGCVRIVFSEPSYPDGSLPFLKACTPHLDLKQLPPSSFGEVSRLAVISRFRRRTGESKTPSGLLFFHNQTQQEGEKRGFPVIAVSLYLAATAIGMNTGMERVFVLMEPRLARHLRYFGFVFQQVGDFIEFRGRRAPYQIVKEEIISGLPPHIAELLTVIRSQLNLPSLQLNPEAIFSKTR